MPLKYLAAYAATLIVMLGLDLLWLGIVAKPLYQQGIGHLMAQQPRLGVAALFYALYALGLVVFAVLPNAGAPGLTQTALWAGLFGFLAYATYDLTNLATLRGWPVGLSIIDVAWGSAVGAVSSVAGKAVLERFAASSA